MSKKIFSEDSVFTAMGIGVQPEPEKKPETPEETEAIKPAAAEQAKQHPRKIKKMGRPKEPDRENRTKHLQLLLTPSTYNKLYAAYKKSGERSLNEYINRLIDKYAK